MDPITRYTIYGERSSGTTFLENAITTNFNVQVTWEYGWKHFFGFHDFSTDKQKADETLFIGIIRNPYKWLNSFSKELHHIPEENWDINNFLFNEHYSVQYDGRINNKDFNYKTGKQYKNIFELRKMKNEYLTDIMPSKVKNYILINYEDLSNNYDSVMERIRTMFNLAPKYYDRPFKIEYHGKDRKRKFKGEREIELSDSLIERINEQLDWNQENKMGYNKIIPQKKNIKQTLNRKVLSKLL
jgi:ribosomal protein L20